MLAMELKKEAFDAVVFTRMQALARRGYRPVLEALGSDGNHAGMAFTHPRCDAKRQPAPQITLWSDGLVATNTLLWPDRHVLSDEPTPEWQRFIFPEDEKRFAGFIDSVERPSVVDLYGRPICLHARIFALRLMFGSSLCLIIAFFIELAVDLL